MKVGDLVAGTVWMPGTAYETETKPEISVLLPTFRRGASGMFLDSVKSILSQTLSNIELIIIDDASSDGTFEQIVEIQKLDSRVSCLRHPKNLGLPAISEYEGYLRARSEKISFAFDDTTFNPDALERLLEESKRTPHAVVFGHIELPMRDAFTGVITTVKLGSQISQGLLRSSNFIPNSAVLVPRHILDDVGLYDPHIVLARVCDWDLWRRIAERYELRFVDVSVGRENGVISSDSLGNTYSYDAWAAEEWCRTARNERLRPSNFHHYEVLGSDPSHGASTRDICNALATKHAQSRGWDLANSELSDHVEDGYTLIVAISYDASVSLCFDLLPQHLAKRVRVAIYTTGGGLEELARATSVIFVRGVESYRVWIDAAKAMQIPMYYILDDNLPLLAEHHEYSAPGEDFSLDTFRKSLTIFESVFLTSEKLVGYFRDHDLHHDPIYYPVACADQRPLYVDFHHPKIEGEITLAFAGGTHRTKGLWDVIFPALTKLCADETLRVHFVIPQTAELEHLDRLRRLPSNLRVSMLSFEPCYMFAMRRFARYKPDIVLHAPSATRNNPYKTLHPVLAAHLLDAVAVMPNTPPYDEISQRNCAVIVNDPFNSDSWYRELRSLVQKERDVDALKAGNASLCAQMFSCERNAEIFREMNRRHGGEPSWAVQSHRLHKLNSFMLKLGIKTGIVTANAEHAKTMAAQAEVFSALEATAAERQRHIEAAAARQQEQADAIIESMAHELDQYRAAQGNTWRNRFGLVKVDLWDDVSPSFRDVKAFSESAGWRQRRSALGLSESLHRIPYREYRITPYKHGLLRAVRFAVAAACQPKGLLGLEVVSPDNTILDHVVLQIAEQDLHQPVEFKTRSVHLTSPGPWKLRIFVQSRLPVYLYEFSNRRLFGLKKETPTPFMELLIE
ncbi:glycosyltransferase [Cupriavidus sp. H39]|uniref:glycosyltransferase n=1 Tax=Cupriavidus sp. H39 TaxID=3401635 RepID=UPI003D01AB6C